MNKVSLSMGPAMLKKLPGTHILSKLFQSSDIAIITTDNDNKIQDVFVNGSEIFGYSTINLPGMDLMSLVHKDDLQTVLSYKDNTPNNKNCECRITNNNRKYSFIRFTIYNYSKTGLIYYMLCNKTEKYQLKKELEEKESSLENARSANKIGNWEFALKPEKLTWTNSIYEIYGLDKNAFPEPTLDLFLSLVSEDEKEEINGRLNNFLNEGKGTYTHRIKRPDGTIRYISHTSNARMDDAGNITGFYGTSQDITEQKIDALKLKASERKFKSLTENAKDMIGIIDTVGTYSFVSDNVKKLFGYDSAELVDRNAFDFIHPEDSQLIIEKLGDITFQREVALPIFRFMNKQGEYRWVDCHVTNFLDDPEITGLVVNSRDITNKKLYEDQLRSLSVIAREAPQSIILTDAQQRIIWVNKTFEKRTEYTLEEVRNTNPLDFFKLSADSGIITEITNCLRANKPFKGILQNTTKSGKTYWFEANIHPIFDENGKVVQYFSINEDITERLLLQERLRYEAEQQQKQVTAAIIKGQENEREQISRELHDNVNQLLATVRLYLDMQKRVSDPELIVKASSIVTTCIDEIRKISKTLAPPSLSDSDLIEGIQDLIEPLKLATNIQISFKSHGIAEAELSSDMQLAVYRLVQENLSNMLKYSKATRVNISLTAVAGKLTLLVQDNGVGFDPDHKRNGIGINNMINRIETLNGKLQIKSAPGKGYTLFATIPLNDR